MDGWLDGWMEEEVQYKKKGKGTYKLCVMLIRGVKSWFLGPHSN